MDIQFQKLGAENFAELSKYYGRRHDNTCDSVMLDNFLWADYYHVHFCERDDKAVLWIMKILGKMYASLPVCAIEDMPHYFKEIEQYFNDNLHLPLEIYLADQEAVDCLNLRNGASGCKGLPLQRGGVEDIGRKGAPQEEKQPERVQKSI